MINSVPPEDAATELIELNDVSYITEGIGTLYVVLK